MFMKILNNELSNYLMIIQSRQPLEYKRNMNAMKAQYNQLLKQQLQLCSF